MKANDILKWIVYANVDGDKLYITDIPCEALQTEDWWYDHFGACPPAPIPEGRYLNYSYNEIREEINHPSFGYISPDAEIEFYDKAFDVIYLYKIDD